MPEDANPGLPKDSALNYMYFTLPMALNYQRNSYTLWKSALQSYMDAATARIYDPRYVASMDEDKLREMLTKYKIALQPVKQCAAWMTLCRTFLRHFEGDIRNLFIMCHWNIPKILEYIQKNHKKEFPYLSGPKISNYWLYVIANYTDAPFSNLDSLSIAPDTHVIQATVRLQMIKETDLKKNNLQELVNHAWKEALSGTGLSLIDLHTPLWLWSRNGFRELVEC